MSDLNFTAPRPQQYSAASLLKFFSSYGDEVRVPAGQVIFTEDEKSKSLFGSRDKMYFLTGGEVELSLRQQVIGMARAGQIFGELASITHATRSATATARSDCRLLTLNNKQLMAGLQQSPEFALALMDIIASRLRQTVQILHANDSLPDDAEQRSPEPLGKALLAKIRAEAGDQAVMRYAAERVIVEQGQVGVRMYVVLKGEIAIQIGENIVEKIGVGGLFGEMALVSQAPRMASAVAQTDCELLIINRDLFLELVKDNPDFAIAVLGTVGERARYMVEQRV